MKKNSILATVFLFTLISMNWSWISYQEPYLSTGKVHHVVLCLQDENHSQTECIIIIQSYVVSIFVYGQTCLAIEKMRANVIRLFSDMYFFEGEAILDFTTVRVAGAPVRT